MSEEPTNTASGHQDPLPHFPPVTRDSVVYAITNPGGLPQLPSCLGPLMPGEMYQMYVDDNGIWRAAIKRGPVHAEASDASAAPPVDQPAAADDDNGGAGEESINELLARLNLHDVRDVVHRFERQPAASAEGTPYRMIADDTTTAALWDHARTHRASLAPDLRRRVENRDAESTAMRLEVYRVALAAVAQVHVGATAWACTELNAQGLMQQLAPMRRSNTSVMVTIASLDNNTGAVTDTAGVRYSLMGADDGRTVRFESTKTVPGTTNRRTEVLYSMNPAAAIDATPLGRLTAAGHDAATAAAAHDMNLQDAFQIADAYALAPVDQAEAPRHGMLAGLTPLEDTAAHVLRWSRISDEHRRSRSWWVRRLRKMQQQ